MNQETLLQMIENLQLQETIESSSIPNLDLYMDQVITLFEEKLGHTKRYKDDKLLTKTMINNYTKDKLLMPAVKKKYTKDQIQEFKQEVDKMGLDIDTKIENLPLEETTEVEKLRSMMQVILLTEKANYYKRLAEKIIDEKINQ